MNRILKKLAMLLPCILFLGCATIQQSVVTSNLSYNTIWNACIDSISDVQYYSVSSTDKTNGLIIADQAVIGGKGTVSRLNIRLMKSAVGVSVHVRFVPPPMTMGGQGTVDSYITALKQRVPDLKVSEIK
jgi:hypothetical protein